MFSLPEMYLEKKIMGLNINVLRVLKKNSNIPDIPQLPL